MDGLRAVVPDEAAEAGEAVGPGCWPVATSVTGGAWSIMDRGKSRYQRTGRTVHCMEFWRFTTK